MKKGGMADVVLAATVKRLGTIYKIVAIMVTSCAIVAMFPHEGKGDHYDYKVGAVWRGSDLVAPYDFAVMKSVEEVAEEEARERGEAILYYRKNDVTAQRQAGTEVLPQGLRRLMDSVYGVGYMETPEGNEWGRLTEDRRVVVLEGNVGRGRRMGDFVTREELMQRVESSQWRGMERLIDSLMSPTLMLDRSRTALEMESRLSQLRWESEMVMAGEIIVRKGEMVSEERGRRIEALEAENDRRFSEGFSMWGQMGGQLLLALIAFVALYMFLKNTRHEILEDNRKVTFVLVVILLMSAFVALSLWYAPDWVLLVPLCVVPILMRVFFDMRAALYIHLTTTIILANLVPNAFEFIFYQLVTGMMSIIATRDLERRSQFFVVAGVIFASYSLIYTAGVLSQDTSLRNLQMDRYLMFFLNGLLTLMAYPMIYLFERLFGMTTALTLMELSSTNNRALRELSRRAPGTFEHSMQVANIVEDLVSELGGDVLLAKVGALYHDIGKVANPIYFTENQTSGFNPHEELDYEESARMITSHVTEGL
ncbi:MAG: HDIG domain-containing protein, partial [Bacteroidales bacterium]|nr:HDIG domain-containing protein [Bacteroidales bacterium]